MQSESADFASGHTGAATWRIGPNILVELFAPLCENMTSSTKLEVHNVFMLAVREGPSHGSGNMYRKLAEIWTRGV